MTILATDNTDKQSNRDEKKLTIKNILLKKANGEKTVAITSYTYNMAVISDKFCDIVLVGDSLGMVLYGMDDTTEVTLETMILHAKAVKKACKRALVVCDIPFGYYEASPEFAFTNISKVIKQTGVDAVKIEGGEEMCETISFLTKRGIQVMGHVGLMPQRIRSHGTYGKIKTDLENIIKSSKALEHAGCFSIVIENTDHQTASTITKQLKIPTIGIGSGSECDGQIAVLEDIVGLSVKQPPFSPKYLDLSHQISNSISKYASATKTKSK